MWIHYDNQTAALTHLIGGGWRQLENGAWVSRDGTCAANIHPVIGRGQVCICYREVA